MNVLGPNLSAEIFVTPNVSVDNVEYNKYPNIYLLNYHIDSHSDNYYLKYMLIKNPVTNLLQFPFFEINEGMFCNGSLEISQLENFIKLYILNTLAVSVKDEYINNIRCKGFYKYKNNYFCLTDISSLKFNLVDLHLDIDIIWFGLVNEIINTKKIYDCQIDCHVTNFFLNNYPFLILELNYTELQIPIEAYLVVPYSKLSLSFNYGIQPSLESATFGPYFYFYNYNNAIAQISDININNMYLSSVNNKNDIEWAVIRYVTFLNDYKFIDSLNTDESYIKDILLNNNNSKNYELLTLNKTDYDGLWANRFDSLHIGKILLDDGSLFFNYPIYVLKDESQFKALSYHYLCQKT